MPIPKRKPIRKAEVNAAIKSHKRYKNVRCAFKNF